jgi:hypothetical protein
MKPETKALRAKQKRIALANDMRDLSDSLRGRSTIESDLSRIAEALIFLLEEKK